MLSHRTPHRTAPTSHPSPRSHHDMLATLPSPSPLPTPVNKRGYPTVHHVIAPPRRPRRYPRLTFDNNGELQANPIKTALKLGARSTEYSLPPLSAALPPTDTSSNAPAHQTAPISHRHAAVVPPHIPPPASSSLPRSSVPRSLPLSHESSALSSSGKPFPLSSVPTSTATPDNSSYPTHPPTVAARLPHPSAVSQPYSSSVTNMLPASQPTSTLATPAQYASAPYTSTAYSSTPYVSASYATTPNALTSAPSTSYPSYSPPILSSSTESALPPPPRRLPVEERASGRPPPPLHPPVSMPLHPAVHPQPPTSEQRSRQAPYWSHSAVPENHATQVYNASPQSTLPPGTPSLSAPSPHSASPYTSTPYTTLRSAPTHTRTAGPHQSTHYEQSATQFTCSVSDYPPTRPLRSDERVQISNLTTQQSVATPHIPYDERAVNGYGYPTSTDSTTQPAYQPRPAEPMHLSGSVQRDRRVYRSGAGGMSGGTPYWQSNRSDMAGRGPVAQRPHHEFRRFHLVRDTELQRVRAIARNKIKVKMNLRGRTKIEHWLLKDQVVSKATALLIRAFSLDSMILSSSASARKACLEKMKNDDLRLLEALMIRLGNKNGYDSWALLTENFTPDSFC